MRVTNANLHWLNFLVSLRDHHIIRYLIKHQNPQQQHILSEIVFNTLQGVIPISKKDKGLLKIHKKILRNIVSSSVSDSQRRYYFQKVVVIVPILVSRFLKYYESRNDTDSKGKVRTSNGDE